MSRPEPYPAPHQDPLSRTRPRVLIPAISDDRLPFVPPGDWRRIRLDGGAMGTVWGLDAHVPPGLPPAELQAAVRRGLARANALFSLWDPRSEISRINADPGPVIGVSPDFAAVLAPLLDLAGATGGASDPALGALTALWGFGPAGPLSEDAPLPGAGAVAAARALSGWRLARLDGGGRLERPPGLLLDLGGSAKGWAADLVSRNLRDIGAGAHLFDLGGELVAAGLRSDMMPWWVDVERPGAAQAALRLGLFDLAVATSGDWRRGFDRGGRRYSHTIDPATGAPLQGGAASATVLHGSAMMADALASAMMVLGPVAGIAHAARTGVAALVTERGPDGTTEHFSPALERMMQHDIQL